MWSVTPRRIGREAYSERRGRSNEGGRPRGAEWFGGRIGPGEDRVRRPSGGGEGEAEREGAESAGHRERPAGQTAHEGQAVGRDLARLLPPRGPRRLDGYAGGEGLERAFLLRFRAA